MDHTTREPGTDAGALTTFLESGMAPVHVRSLVAESWVRSAAAGVDADAGSVPVPDGSRDVSGYRADHRLARVFPLLYDVLGRVAEDCECVMAIGHRYPDGEFLNGDADIHLGDLHVDGLRADVPFWMSVNQYEYWKHTHLTVDVVPGRGSGFSVEAPEGVRFPIRSRLMSDAESAAFGLS